MITVIYNTPKLCIKARVAVTGFNIINSQVLLILKYINIYTEDETPLFVVTQLL